MKNCFQFHSFQIENSAISIDLQDILHILHIVLELFIYINVNTDTQNFPLFFGNSCRIYVFFRIHCGKKNIWNEIWMVVALRLVAFRLSIQIVLIRIFPIIPTMLSLLLTIQYNIIYNMEWEREWAIHFIHEDK